MLTGSCCISILYFIPVTQSYRNKNTIPFLWELWPAGLILAAASRYPDPGLSARRYPITSLSTSFFPRKKSTIQFANGDNTSVPAAGSPASCCRLKLFSSRISFIVVFSVINWHSASVNVSISASFDELKFRNSSLSSSEFPPSLYFPLIAINRDTVLFPNPYSRSANSNISAAPSYIPESLICFSLYPI